MPSLFSLAQHPALVEFQTHLADGEAVFAYLDDLYVVAAPERIRPLYDLLEEVLWRHARVQLNGGKTRIWNAAGEEPPHIARPGVGWSVDPPRGTAGNDGPTSCVWFRPP